MGAPDHSCQCHHSEHDAGRIPLHRHRRAYAAINLKGRYLERGPEGVWACEEGDIVVHPTFHIHSNDIERPSSVLNVEFADARATRVEYGVYQLRDPDILLYAPITPEALDSAIENARLKSPLPAADWRDAFAQRLAADPSQSVAELAADFGVSAEHASRAFGALYMLTPAAFRAEHRLRRALRALLSPASLAEIAHACGFSDQAHMTRAFSGALGHPPARLRALLRGAAHEPAPI